MLTVRLALYGKPYLSAARDTWRLFLDRGIDALVNDSLVGISQARAFLRICTALTHSDSHDLGSVRCWDAFFSLQLLVPEV